MWLKASRLQTLILRSTPRWKGLYHQRRAVEREFGSLKDEWGRLPLRAGCTQRVRLDVDLTILAHLGNALGSDLSHEMAT